MDGTVALWSKELGIPKIREAAAAFYSVDTVEEANILITTACKQSPYDKTKMEFTGTPEEPLNGDILHDLRLAQEWFIKVHNMLKPRLKQSAPQVKM